MVGRPFRPTISILSQDINPLISLYKVYVAVIKENDYVNTENKNQTWEPKFFSRNEKEISKHRSGIFVHPASSDHHAFYYVLSSGFSNLDVVYQFYFSQSQEHGSGISWLSKLS